MPPGVTHVFYLSELLTSLVEQCSRTKYVPRSSAPEHITFKGGFLRGSWRLKVFSSFVMEVKKLVRATPYSLLFQVKVKKLVVWAGRYPPNA